MQRGYFQNTTILYVEPEESINEVVSKFLKTFFKKIITAKDGQEGLDIYELDFQTSKEIDLILTEIDMPKQNGLEMIKNIKQINPTVPFIVLTDEADTQYMLEAIRLGVTHYVIKPLVVDDLILQLEEVCQNKFQNLTLTNKEKELQEYINILNQVAIVSTTTPQGIITDVNDIFCSTSLYTKDELIGQPHNIIRHPDNPKELFENLWSTIQSGQTWSGKVKNKAKDGSPYYVDATIFPLFYDDNQTIKGYMGVRFLTTQTELEKRNFKQKVMQNLIQQKSIICAYEETITNLKTENDRLKSYLNDDINIVYERLDKEKQKNSRLLSQLDSYEKQFENAINKNQEISKKAKQSEQKAYDELKQLKIKYESAKVVIQNQANEITKKEKVIYTLQERIDEYLKKIANLDDVIKFKEKQLSSTTQDKPKEQLFYYDNV